MRFTLKPLAKQVVVITGASSGIGLATARMMASAGAAVFLIARNEAALSGIVAEITTNGGTAGYAVADVGDADALRAAAEVAIARFGLIDTWVNAAGVAIYAALVDTPLDEHERLFRTNYFGVVNGAQIAIGHLRQNGGVLITVGSIAGDVPSPVMGAYAASKHAVKGYIESLRVELNYAQVPICVTLIKPSGIGTPIAEHAAVHVAGRPLIPPPVYDPLLVADAICDAAAHPRVNVTVGGIGRLQVLGAMHFPKLFARLGGATGRLMVAAEGAASEGNNLHRPGSDGRVYSRENPGRTVSVYGTPRRRRLLAAAGVVTLAALYAVGSRRSTKRERHKNRTTPTKNHRK
jgi:short-subunit dehydrogenase